MAVQRSVHDLTTLEQMPRDEQDHVIGRFRGSNEEISDAPASAHVKRAAQESFNPEAFTLRRSMPWGDVRRNGLYFVAFARSLDPFERVLTRMVGLEDWNSGRALSLHPTRHRRLLLVPTRSRRAARLAGP